MLRGSRRLVGEVVSVSGVSSSCMEKLATTSWQQVGDVRDELATSYVTRVQGNWSPLKSVHIALKSRSNYALILAVMAFSCFCTLVRYEQPLLN